MLAQGQNEYTRHLNTERQNENKKKRYGQPWTICAVHGLTRNYMFQSKGDQKMHSWITRTGS